MIQTPPLARPATVTSEHAKALLGHLGGHDLPRPGGFFHALLGAMLKADHPNLSRLSLGFPELAQAVYLYAWTEGGYHRLCDLAGAQPADDLIPTTRSEP